MRHDGSWPNSDDKDAFILKTLYMKSVSILVPAIWFTAVISSICAQQVSGIGAALGKEGETLVVKHILPDSPAARSNALQVGDRILEISESDTPAVQARSLKLDEAVRLIRGAQGTSVRLTIIPVGKEEAHVRIVVVVRGELKELSRWGDGKLLPTGTIAPNTKWIRVADRKSEQLADFSGKVIVLEFWATWCGPCQPIMAGLQNLPQKFNHWAGKVALISASVDESPDSTERHLKEKGWSKTHNVWVGTETIKAFGVNALPTTYIISKRGAVVSSGHALDVADTVNRLIDEN
jgi:thiol-disulfide isomerase/thioredoxin